jgi:hypothetical protein
MDFSHEIIVNVARERFVELFDDPDNLPKWQEGLVAFEPLGGTPGHPGATSKLTFKRGRGTMEMVETITRREMPDAFDGTYDARGVHNISRNEFHEVGPGATRWVAHNVFEFRGAMKVIGLLFGKSFPKENQKFMEAFKAFAERAA